jgi:hypothetical protein
VSTCTRAIELFPIFLIPAYIYWLTVPQCNTFSSPNFHTYPLSLIRFLYPPLYPHPCCAESFLIPRVLFLVFHFFLFALPKPCSVSVLVMKSPKLTTASAILLSFHLCSKLIVPMFLSPVLFVPLRPHTVFILVTMSPMLTFALVLLLSSYVCSTPVVLMFVVMYAVFAFIFPSDQQLSLTHGDPRFRTHN